MRNKVPGHIKDIRFRNIAVTDQPGPYRVQVSGADGTHKSQDIVFDNIEILGAKLNSSSEQFQKGPHAEGILFK